MLTKKRYKHNLSKTELTTFDPGEFIPIGCMEIAPGDSIQGKTDAVIRALPMLAPLMHEVEVIITHSFVPFRLIWEDFEDFITGGDDGLNASVLPTIDFSGSAVAKGDLANYLGLPVGFDSTASALPFRAYSMFYNDHLLDEELQTALTIDKSGGVDNTTNTSLKNVNWSGDRLTKAQANEQLGSAISIPLGTEAPIYGKNMDFDGIDDSANQAQILDGIAGTLRELRTGGAAADSLYGSNVTNGSGQMMVDLTNATAATINELREAVALQKFAEMRQIYGSTYEKLIQADFGGIKPLDARLQNSEIISKGRGMLNFSEVLATAETGTSVDVGDMKGHGIAAMRTNKFRKFFTEFGYLLSFVSVRPKAVYSQGVPRHFLKSSKEDFYNPHLENMGFQEITNREVKHDHSTPGGTFAYEPRYQEYRGRQNSYKGDFTDSSLNYWHMGRDLSGDPALNSSFITCSPTQRVFAQSTTDNLLGMFRHNMVGRRLLKKSVRPTGLI
jgi:hypothetical protein